MQKIFIYGPPGSGKTSVGKQLAKNLNAGFIDIDEQIENETGMTISEYISQSGEIEFRDLEQKIIEQTCLLDESGSIQLSRLVVALGGGSLLRVNNRENCEKCGDVVFLDADLDTLLSRLIKQEGQRPLLVGDVEKSLRDLLAKREEHYSSFKLRIATFENKKTNRKSRKRLIVKTPSQIAWKIQQKIGCYYVTGMGSGYDILVETGSLSRFGLILSERGFRGSVAIVCDEIVDALYSEKILTSLKDHGFQVQKVIIKPGEENKSIETVVSLWRDFVRAGLDRKSVVVALGGGVVIDLAGFASSTYMRGCNWVAVPTTLLSMVDASVGGKTGFDLPEGKNLVGSFYPPRFVLSDPSVLRSLPESELRSGMAEVIKHAIISDPDLFEMCANGFEFVMNNLSEIVKQAIAVKVKTIIKDPYERGLRASLNLGHTVGHGVEIASNFRIKHGEAVAIGMAVEARLAYRLGILESSEFLAELTNILTKMGLPIEIPSDLSTVKIIEAMQVDKKKDRGVIKFALPVSVGVVKVGVSVENLAEVL